MRGGNERLQLLRSAVGRIGGVGQHAVIAPAARARKVRDRHEFNDRDPKRGEIVEPPLNPGKAAFGSEGADVQLIDDRFMPGPAAPGAVRPGEGAWIHHGARALRILGVEARRRVCDLKVAIDTQAVEAARLRLAADDLKPAARQRLHGKRALCAAHVQHDVHPACGGRPYSKAHPVSRQLRAEGHGMAAAQSASHARPRPRAQSSVPATHTRSRSRGVCLQRDPA